MVDDKDAIGDLMQGILDAVVSRFASDEVVLPSRRYLAIGQVAHDCEQLTVSFQQMYLGPPGAQSDAPSRCNEPRTVVLTVQLTRCVPSPETRSSGPLPQAMTDDTLVKTGDAWLLMDGVLEAYRDDYIGVLTDVSVTDPNGGYQSVVLNVVSAVP